MSDDVLDAFALGVRTGAAHVRETEALDCDAAATDRIDVYGGQSLEGAAYSCPNHVAETVAAIEATGATAVRCLPGEFEPAHLCGQVVSYVGEVIL